MALYLPIRAFNRSQNVRIESKKIVSTASSFIDLSKATTYKEFSYHSALGAVFATGPATTSMTVTLNGLGVTPKETESKEIKIAAGELRVRGTQTPVVVAATEKTLTKTTTKARIDLVLVKLADGTVSVSEGTAAESPVAPEVAEGYVAIAEISLPKETEKIKASNITSLRAYL